MIIAIDFDGTIVDHKYPAIGELKPDAKEVINDLATRHNIIIWTCRGGQELNAMIDFLDREGIRYDRINENMSYEWIGFKPFPKVYADCYIDDRNLGGFPGWGNVQRILLKEGAL